MQRTIKTGSVVLAASIMFGACSSARITDTETSRDNSQTTITPISAIRRTVLYKTSGDCRNLVPVTLSADGKSIVWYPAVSDITAYSAPVERGDGWLEDRIGVGPNTVYTDYTLDQYRNLTTTPSASELMRHILPDMRVTDIRTE